MSKRKVGHSPKLIQNVFVLLLLALFATLSTFLVTIGAQVYRNTVDSAEKNNNMRIMTAVVRSAIWEEDGGEVEVQHPEYQGKRYDVLSITNQYGDDTFIKRLYEHDGYLWESFTDSEMGFDPEYGETLCELNRFEPVMDGKVLTVGLETKDGIASTVRMYLRAGGAEE